MPPLCITGKFLIEYFSLAKLESLWNLTPRISVGAELASWPSNKLPFYGFMFELRANICIPRNQAVEPSMRASRDHTNLVVLENGANGPGTKFWKPFPKARVKAETISMCSVDAHYHPQRWALLLSPISDRSPGSGQLTAYPRPSSWGLDLNSALFSSLGFTGGSDSKVSALPCNAGDPGSIPGLGRSPGERKWQPTPVSLPGKLWTEEPGRLQSMGSQRVGHDWATSLTSLHCLALKPSFCSQIMTALIKQVKCPALWPGKQALWLPGTKSPSCLSSHQVCQDFSLVEGSSLDHPTSVPLLALSPPPTWPSLAGSARPLASLSGCIDVASAGLLAWRSLLGIFCASPPGVGGPHRQDQYRFSSVSPTSWPQALVSGWAK